MSENGINVQSIDFDQYSSLFEQVTRRLSFPDSVERLITLDSRYWKAFDHLCEAWVPIGNYEQTSYDWALERFKYGTPEFEEEIRYWFKGLIRSGWSMHCLGDRPTSNDA